MLSVLDGQKVGAEFALVGAHNAGHRGQASLQAAEPAQLGAPVGAGAGVDVAAGLFPEPIAHTW